MELGEEGRKCNLQCTTLTKKYSIEAQIGPKRNWKEKKMKHLTHKKKECFIKTARIIHQCRKTTVLSHHRCLINTGVEKMNYI